MKKLIRNAIKTPDGTILNSRYRHDYVNRIDKNGKHYFVDGGLSYQRRSSHNDTEDLCVYDDSPFEDIREAFEWGSYGKDGKDKLRFIKLKDMTDDHINAIIDGGYGNCYIDLFKKELEFRGQKMKKQTTKICPICGCDKMVSFISINKKTCPDCGNTIHWELEDNQKPIFGEPKKD